MWRSCLMVGSWLPVWPAIARMVPRIGPTHGVQPGGVQVGKLLVGVRLARLYRKVTADLAKARTLGLPDPALRQNAGGSWSYTPPDWNELRTVVSNHGPRSAERLAFRRLNYDYEKTIQKIYAIPDLEPFLGDRLRQGR